MSTPIKPPGADDVAATPTADGPFEASDAAAVEGAPGEFRALVEGASSVEDAGQALEAGALDPAGAVEQLVQRALTGAAGLDEAARGRLEAQLRAALAEDPTLLALQEDLRGAS